MLNMLKFYYRLVTKVRKIDRGVFFLKYIFMRDKLNLLLTKKLYIILQIFPQTLSLVRVKIKFLNFSQN